MAVHVVEAPGNSVVEGQLTVPAFASATATEVSVTFPVFFTRNDQEMVSPKSFLPSAFTSWTTADFWMVMAGVRTSGVEVDEGLDVTVVPLGLLPVAVAVLLTTPASPSAWVMMYGAAVQVTEAPGATLSASR